MGDTGPENEVESRNRLGREFLDDVLTSQEIDPQEFYRLARALERTHCIEDVKPALNLHTRAIRLIAVYTGEEQLGSKRVQDPETQGWGIKPEVQEGVERLFDDIAEKTGFQFHQPHGLQDENSCSAYTLVKDASSLHIQGYAGKLEVLLIKNNGNL